MREIKFRAWDKDKKWMVYDVQDAYDGLWSERNSDEVNDYYGYVSTFQSFTDEEEFNFMQYTGLKDRNGVEIYEGDVLQNVGNPHVDKLLFKVIWSKHYGAWFWWALEGELRMDYLGQSITEDCEVIGNIHDNPELMGEKK